MTISAWSLLLVGAFSVSTLAVNTKMKEVFSWKHVDFAFTNEEARQAAIASGRYIPKNNLPLGLDVWKNRVFITLPRWRTGTPATLAYAFIDPNGKRYSPKLIPYPDWESNRLPTKTDPKTDKISIISVFRVQVDVCDRLWVMDGGKANILGAAKKNFQPQILIYDLNTDRLIKRYILKENDVKPNSFMANINVDVEKEDCGNAFAYISDLGANGVVVYSLKEDDSWRVHHNYFHFDPLNGNFIVNGINFQTTDGIFSFALSKRGQDGYKTAYFHPWNSLNEFKVSTKILRNKTIASNSYYEYKLIGYRGPNTQASASFLDLRSGVVFYTQVNRNGIGCWNSNQNIYTPLNQALVTSDSTTFVFPNDLKVDRYSNLWVLTDRLPEFIFKEINPEEVSTRIFMAPVKDLIKGTVCESRQPLSFKPTWNHVPTYQPTYQPAYQPPTYQPSCNHQHHTRGTRVPKI